MATSENTRSSEDLRSYVSELEERIEALEGIFSARLLDRENAHVRAKQQDAREQLRAGETHRLVVDSPPGAGRDPTKAVGRLNGIVTFVESPGMHIQENDVVEVCLTDVQRNCAKAVIESRIE